MDPYPRCQEGALWRVLSWAEEIRFWRTAEGKEVDFVLPDTDEPMALEVKLDEKSNQPGKHKLFMESYPSIPFRFVNLNPRTEEVLRKEF
ncbi:hypothetical protein SAMN03080617_04254 [Algoriphagus alkaliphilus]|uniref:DUF4143 domain-containing protein n=1 Tax=Algoriphagus alkaliphilus TaxID=279824 RepID=A0A1G5ZP41_9BACT|nr:hypothetical protein [Algoriphagus alkaliphilus]SDA96579.1 hypothetical protein SAMN03080617_04254 [Algoriphagus alkaliphilus]